MEFLWEDAFVARVQKRGADECWEWLGYVNPRSRYGTLSQKVNGKTATFYAHRMAWELVNGPIPKEMTIDHRPDCPRLCCNPTHLEVVTLSENSRRGTQKRYGVIGNESECRHGHIGHRYKSGGKWRCGECNRAYDRRPENVARRKAKRAKSA